MKKLLALLLAVVMVAGLAACGSSAPASGSGDAEPAASSGDAVRLFNGKIEIAEPLEHAAKAYEEATGNKVEVESLGGGVDLQATLKQYFQAGNMPTSSSAKARPISTTGPA